MDDLAHVSFLNPEFLEKNGLTPKNVLDYFYTSPFYPHFGQNSLNEQRRRGLQVEAQAGSHEFVLRAANEDAKAGRVETSIFVLQLLQHPSIFKESFYVISGTIYKAPELSELIKSAIGQSAFGATSILKKQLEAMRIPLPEATDDAKTTAADEAIGWPAWCQFETGIVPAAWRAPIESAEKVHC